MSRIRIKTSNNIPSCGFTLVELMVTLAIAAILATLAIPSFSAMIKSNRLTTQANQWVTALNMARSEAINRRVPLDVVASDASNSANEWGKGWNVTINGGATLKIFPALTAGTTLDSAGGISTIQYLANGRASVSDTITLCDDRSGETGRQITILITGRVVTSNVTCS